jgi:hypothetical protein
MPLQRQKANLTLLPRDRFTGESLEELLGSPQLRPGELHEAFPQKLPQHFCDQAARTRIPISLAVSTVVERALVLHALASINRTAMIDVLDRAAEMSSVSSTTVIAAAYVRELLALLQGYSRVAVAPGEPVVIPVRVADRLRATGYRAALEPSALMPALRWELAAVLAGQSIAEWASFQILQAES